MNVCSGVTADLYNGMYEPEEEALEPEDDDAADPRIPSLRKGKGVAHGYPEDDNVLDEFAVLTAEELAELEMDPTANENPAYGDIDNDRMDEDEGY